MKRLLFLALAAVSINASAQQPCGTEIQYKKMLEKNPQAAQTRQQLEDFTKSWSSDPSHRQASTVKIIPVVFHIIHNYGTENISKAQVLDAVRILNEDFRKLNADTTQIVPPFKPIAADAQIEFRLAQLDPNGNCTDGITRTVSPLTYNADDNVKELISWDNNRYLNIWVVANISFGAGGYAYYPGTAPSGGEGVVVLHTQLGSIGTSCGSNFCARTLTHEVGHYFNLAHTWGSNNDCGNSSACSDDDNVTDTPNTSGSCLTCNLAQNSCGFLDNVQNYMDYSSCTHMFTQGQAQRMDAAINSSVGGRSNLWQAANLASTGVLQVPAPVCVPVPDFKANTMMVCAGSTVNFKDYSWNAHPTAWSWQFPGGTPATSNDSMPIIQYTTPGIYNVTLTASTTAGSASLTKAGYIIVDATTADYNASFYSEGFETNTVPGTDWQVMNTGGGPSWQRNASVGASGTASAYINNNNNSSMEVDELISPSINLSQIPSPVLTFKLAFAAWDTLDKLQIFLSRDCGKTWSMRYNKYGSALITSFSPASNFIPSVNDWRMESVSVASYANDPNVLVKFKYTYGAGKNIYIDNINISTGTIGINDLENTYQLSVYPNPADDNAMISFTLPSKQEVSLNVYNALGQEVHSVAASEMTEGDHQVNINTSLLSPGIYIAELNTVQGKLVRRLVIR